MKLETCKKRANFWGTMSQLMAAVAAAAFLIGSGYAIAADKKSKRK